MTKPRPLADIVAEMRAADASTLTVSRAQDYARETYCGYGGWIHSWHWRDTDDLTRYRDEARRVAALMQADIDDTQSRLDATRVLLDLLDEAIAADAEPLPASASPADPMPTPGPSSVVAQAAGEGGGLRERLARLVADGLPVTLAYHPDADPGDGSGWSVEVGDRHEYGQLEDALTRATGPFSVWNESKSMDLGEG